MSQTYFFPRDESKPLVSILLPSRGRADKMIKAIDSLHSRAWNQAHLEWILKLDSDDLPSIRTFESFQKLVPTARALVSPRGNGYKDLHIWINQLCTMATGDWLFVWNDDASLAEGMDNWDFHLLHLSITDKATWHGVRDIFSGLCKTIERPEAGEFAFIRRKIIDILGHYAPTTHVDSYLNRVLGLLSSVFPIPLSITHSSSESKDKVREEVLEVYKTAGYELNSVKVMKQMVEDVNKLIVYIEKEQEQKKIVVPTPEPLVFDNTGKAIIIEM